MTSGRSLQYTRIEYGRDDDPSLTEEERAKLPEGFEMRNGQLMGSPLSFPIVAYKTALRRFVKAKGGNWEKALHKSLPDRVNGDDILFKANKEFYEGYWKPAVAAIGFTLSPGKNYIAEKFLTVNSEGWRPLKNGRFEKIGYLNTGLGMAVCVHLSGSAHAEMPWTGKFDEALQGCIKKHRTLGRLLHYYGNDVRAHTRGGVN